MVAVVITIFWQACGGPWKELAGPGRDFFEVFANAPI
jgi:hypothetical protein